jgi:uncharacterized membrane protein YeiH
VKIGQAVTSSDAAARLLFAADIAGTLVFATEGAMAAINNGLDLLGVMVLAFATALGGGIIRDTLLQDAKRSEPEQEKRRESCPRRHR